MLTRVPPQHSRKHDQREQVADDQGAAHFSIVGIDVLLDERGGRFTPQVRAWVVGRQTASCYANPAMRVRGCVLSVGQEGTRMLSFLPIGVTMQRRFAMMAALL